MEPFTSYFDEGIFALFIVVFCGVIFSNRDLLMFLEKLLKKTANILVLFKFSTIICKVQKIMSYLHIKVLTVNAIAVV